MVLRDRMASSPGWLWPKPWPAMGARFGGSSTAGGCALLQRSAGLNGILPTPVGNDSLTCRRFWRALIGDLPFYVAHDSADVWANRQGCFRCVLMAALFSQKRCSTRLLSPTRPALGARRCIRWWRHRWAAFAGGRTRLRANSSLLLISAASTISAPLRPTGTWPATRQRPIWPGRWRTFSLAMPLLGKPAGACEWTLRLIAEDLGVIIAGGGGVARSLRWPGMEDPPVRPSRQRRNAYLPAN